MEVNNMLCVGRSRLSGFIEGTTRRKLFSSPETSEIVDESGHSRSDSRSNIDTNPQKKSILRGHVVGSGQSSPSSVRSVRFSRNDEDYSIECAKLHVNQTTQTVEKGDLPERWGQSTDVGKDSAFTVQSERSSYIELVGSPKAQKMDVRGSAPTTTLDMYPRSKPLSKPSKSVQTSDPQLPDGCKIIQTMDVAGPIARDKHPDGNKIIQNLELGMSKSKCVQTDDTSLSATIATQTPSVPDGNKIIRNMESEFSLPKYSNSATQTPAVPDGSKIIQNMDLDTPRSSAESYPVFRNVAIQTGTTNNSGTQTPAVPDGSRIIQNMELDTPRSIDRNEPASLDVSLQTGRVSNSSTQTLDIPDGRKIFENLDLHTLQEQNASFKSVSVQTKTDYESEIPDGSKIIQNMEVGRIRSPSPDTMDQSFGFDVDVSSISTQTNPEKPDVNETVLQHEPVLIYNKTDTGYKPLIISYNDDVREEEKLNASQVLSAVSRSAMVDRDQVIPDRVTFRSKREDTQPDYNWKQNKNTQTFSTASSKSAPPYSTQQKSVYEKLLNLSYPRADISKESTGTHNGILGMPVNQWIAPTVSTKLQTKYIQSTKQHTTQSATSPINTREPSIPVTQKPTVPTRSRHEDLPIKPKLAPQTFDNKLSTGNINKSHMTSSASLQVKYDQLYKHNEETSHAASKLNTFSRSPIDVYSFDPESVKQSKRLLSNSTTKESITKNRFVKGIDLYTPSPRPAGSLSISSHTASRSRSHDAYMAKINTRTSQGISKTEPLHSSRYANLYKPTVSVFGTVPALHAPKSTRSRSIPSRFTDDRFSVGTKHTSLTPALNLIRSSAIRKSAMNVNNAKHISHPSSGSSSEPSLSYSYGDRSSLGSKPYLESSHRSRSREINRGTNSRVDQSGLPINSTSIYERTGNTPLYLDSLMDASNARPRSRERSLKSASPSSSSSEYLREHNRSRSSSTTKDGNRDETITAKPPIPRKVSRSPQRRPSPVNKWIEPPERDQLAMGTNTSSFQHGQMHLSDTTYNGDAISAEFFPDASGNLYQGSNKLTIGATPPGIVDRDCVYLDERTMKRIIERANLC